MIYSWVDENSPFLGRLMALVQALSSNGNTYQVAYCRNKIGAAWFQPSASDDSSDEFHTTHTSVIYDGCLCHNRLFISDACSAEILWTMGTARSYWSIRIYCLGVYAGGSWLRISLQELAGRGHRQNHPPPFLLSYSARGGYAERGWTRDFLINS